MIFMVNIVNSKSIEMYLRKILKNNDKLKIN